MKILLDTCVGGGVVQELRAAGHDVVWAGDWQEDPAWKAPAAVIRNEGD